MNELVGADKALMYPLYSAFLVYVQNLGSPQLLKVLAIGSTTTAREALNKINAEEKMDLENSLESESSSSFAGKICYFLDIFASLLFFEVARCQARSLNKRKISGFLFSCRVSIDHSSECYCFRLMGLLFCFIVLFLFSSYSLILHV